MSSPDDTLMRRALRLAMNGRGRVEPNPTVGCVIATADGRVIGEGYHEQFGGPHAEPNALAACVESPAGATAYVTLEPCCHTNKKTPPCAPRLIAAGLARVIVGCTDPNPAVSGRGVALLESAGITVSRSPLEPECRQLIAPFVARVTYGRPYVTLKWAQTADGKVAGPGGRRLQISNAASSRLVHALRARSDAILVGARTAINDDPVLTARGVDHARPLLRAVLDRDLDIPLTGRLVATAGEHALIVYCSERATRDRPDVVAALTGSGATAVAVPLRADRLSLPAVLQELGRRSVTHLLVEPGPSLAASFLSQGLADRVWVIHSPNRLDDPHAPGIAPFDLLATGELEIEGDRLTEYLNPASPVYFGPYPSADLVLASTAVRSPGP